MTARSGGRRRAAIVAAAAGVSLLAAGVLGVFGGDLSEPQTFAADAYSPSAIGHRAFVALLRESGLRVIVSRHRTADKAADGAVVVLAEPVIADGDPGERARGVAEDVSGRASALLVVLPKRTGLPDRNVRGWLFASELLPTAAAERVLAALHLEARVVRPDHPVGAWSGALPAPTLDEPQLIRSDRLAPLVASADGMLAGELEAEGRRVVVLADPDVLANHGLGRGDNAVLAVRLLERLGAGDRAVVVDETLHGLELQPSLARELFRFPLALATAQALLVAALLVWAALVPFGRPIAAPPPLAAGKAFLIDNTAALVARTGALGPPLAAYLRAAKDAVLHRLRGAGDRDGDADAGIARLAAARGRADALAALEARVRALGTARRGADEALRTARDIHDWREEMAHGADRDPRDHRAAQG